MISTERRSFLALVAAAAAGPAFTAGSEAGHRGNVIVNALGSLNDPNLEDDPLYARTPRVIAEAHASGVSAINITLGQVTGPKNTFEETVRDVARWDAIIRHHSGDLMRVDAGADIKRAAATRRIGLIYGFQNLAMLENNASRADIFADLGVRVFQLTYNPANQLGDGSMAPGNHGLTPFGRKVIARLNAKRVMVDLSHSGVATCLEAIRASTAPVSINHTGCRALVDLPRNKTDAELREVARRGGFVGIYFMPFLNLSGHAHAQDVVAHIDHAVNVCGEDHVGIGTDGSISQIDDLRVYEGVLASEIKRRRAAGISALGEQPDAYPFVVDLRGPDQFRKLATLLAAKGYKATRIDKILGLNFLRYAEAVWGS